MVIYEDKNVLDNEQQCNRLCQQPWHNVLEW